MLGEVRYPDEVETHIVLWEDARRQVWVNAAERNEPARRSAWPTMGRAAASAASSLGRDICTFITSRHWRR
jgi:hypothetical protein